MTNQIALNGRSGRQIAEFFGNFISLSIDLSWVEFSICNILFQRNVYPEEDFTLTNHYGISLYTASNPKLKEYITQFMTQLEKWIDIGKICRLVLVLSSKDTREVSERWQFQINKDASDIKPHSTDQMNKQIAALMRQISASISFLPIPDDELTFNILAYTDKDAPVPMEWIDSDAREILKPQMVKLRSVQMNETQIESLVSYKISE